MHTGVYLQKSMKHTIPTELLELVLKNNTSGMGVASAKIGGFAQKGSGAPTVEAVEAFQKEHLEHAILFYFYEATDDFLSEDIQPYVIIKDDNEAPVLAAFLDGPFDRHKENDGHTPEYHAAFDYLQDRLLGLYAITHGDIPKMLDLMRAKNLRKEITNVIGEGNSITLIANNGEIVSYGPVENIRKETWGWSTNYYGFGEKAVVKEEVKPKGLDALFAKKDKVNNPSPQTLQAVAVKDEKVDKGPGLQEAASVIHQQEASADGNKKIWVIPDPAFNWSNNKKSSWYHNLQPAMDRNAWKETPPVETTMNELIRLKIGKYKIVDAPKATKDTTSHNVPQPTPATPPNQVVKSADTLVSVIPRVPADEAKKIVGIIQNAKGVIDPETFKGMERKYPTILNIAGLKEWDQLHKLDFDDIYKIAENRTAAAVAIMNLIGQHIRMSERVAQIDKAIEAAATTTKQRIAL